MQGAVLIHVTIVDGREEEAQQQLEAMVVPMIKSLPGFQATYHLGPASGTRGVGVVIFDSEENAASAAAGVNSMPRPENNPVTIDSVEVLRVVASA